MSSFKRPVDVWDVLSWPVALLLALYWTPGHTVVLIYAALLFAVILYGGRFLYWLFRT